MPWGVKDKLTQREEFISKVKAKEKGFKELCIEFDISRKTGYKWVAREKGGQDLQDQTRRPLSSPNQIVGEAERMVLQVRRTHPAWGGKKIRQLLINEDKQGVPASSTITEILRRNGMIDELESLKHKAYQRFEYDTPNELWQADFKGNKGWANQVGCHPLTVLDDHSRFNIGLRACPDESKETVQQEFSMLFRQCGMPLRILTDNGSPWGSGSSTDAYTTLTVWLLVLGIEVVHSRPHHPQTGGKHERFNKTVQVEVLDYCRPSSWRGYQPIFDEWRETYNHIRPHEAIGMRVPADKYSPSKREFPETMPSVDYDERLILRKADSTGWIGFKNQYWFVGRAFQGYYVAVVPTEIDGVFNVFFKSYCISTIDLRTNRRRP